MSEAVIGLLIKLERVPSSPPLHMLAQYGGHTFACFILPLLFPLSQQVNVFLL